MALSHCFHKATSSDLLKAGSRDTVAVCLDLPWWQLIARPSPVHWHERTYTAQCTGMHTPTQKTAAKNTPFQLLEHLLPSGCPIAAEFTKTAVVINSWLTQLREEISALLPKSNRLWGSAMVSASPP